MRLIDADALKENAYREGGAQSIAEMVVTVSDIDDAPTVQAFQTVQDVTIEVPVRHGKWIDEEQFKRTWYKHHVFKCSECGNILDFDGVNAGRGDANFCPNCGARMVGGKW